MKAVVQRVLRASVTVDGAIVGEIGRGLLVFLGAAPGDDVAIAEALALRIAQARIFADENGRMNRSLAEVDGRMLVVSQFTLLGDTSQRRPAFIGALEPVQAKQLYERFVAKASALAGPVATGVFGAHMIVESQNDGPVTLLYHEPK